jgi:hypothetical protein
LRFADTGDSQTDRHDKTDLTIASGWVDKNCYFKVFKRIFKMFQETSFGTGYPGKSVKTIEIILSDTAITAFI